MQHVGIGRCSEQTASSNCRRKAATSANRRKRCSCVSRVTATHCTINTITHHASRITHHASPMQPKYKVQSPCQLSPLNSKFCPKRLFCITSPHNGAGRRDALPRVGHSFNQPSRCGAACATVMRTSALLHSHQATPRAPDAAPEQRHCRPHHACRTHAPT